MNISICNTKFTSVTVNAEKMILAGSLIMVILLGIKAWSVFLCIGKANEQHLFLSPSCEGYFCSVLFHHIDLVCSFIRSKCMLNVC